MAYRITAGTILKTLPPALNPFVAVRDALRRELFAEPSRAVRNALFGALGLLGVTFVAAVFCLVIRARRDEFWLYRLARRGDQHLVLPNTVVLWLLLQSLWMLALYPYVLLGSLKLGGCLSLVPIWSALVFVPEFLALWHVAWGACASLVLQAGELGACPPARGRSSAARRRVYAVLLNAFFVGGALAGPVAMLTLTARKTLAWDRGVDAYLDLDARLERWQLAYNETTVLSAKRGGAIVRDGVPNANKLLDAMSRAFRGFESPYWICATFSTLGAVVAAVAAFIHIRRLRRSVDSLILGSAALYSKSTPSVSSTSFRPTHQKSDSDSSTTPMLSSEPSLAPVQQTHKRVVLVLLGLASSGLTYAVLCLVADHAVTHSRIFEMSSSSRLHLYLYMFLFNPLTTLAGLLPPVANPRPSTSLPACLLPHAAPSATLTRAHLLSHLAPFGRSEHL